MIIEYIPSIQILNINVNISDVSRKLKNYFMTLSNEVIDKLIEKCNKDLKSGLRIFLVGELRGENLEIIVDGKLNCVSAINETDAIIDYCTHFDAKFYPPVVVYEIVKISQKFPVDIEIVPTKEAEKIFELRNSIYIEKQKMECFEKKIEGSKLNLKSLKKEFERACIDYSVERECNCHELRVKSGYYDKKE